MIITLEKINKYYTTGGMKFHALKNITLGIEAGETVAITGKSGSGKTTLLNVIGTLDTFDGGAYLYDGKDISKAKDRERARLRANEIGFVNQDFMLLNQQTALENVTLPLYFNDTPYKRLKPLALKALGEVGMEEYAGKKTVNLSGGQKQRVAIARALVISPRLILADEPTGALDRATAKEIITCLTDLSRSKGITVIIVTHDKDVADACGRTIELSDGEIVR